MLRNRKPASLIGANLALMLLTLLCIPFPVRLAVLPLITFLLGFDGIHLVSERTFSRKPCAQKEAGFQPKSK